MSESGRAKLLHDFRCQVATVSLFGNSPFEHETGENVDTIIQGKLEAGKKLSSKEETYLMRTNPIMFAQYRRIQTERHSVEIRIRMAKTKQQVTAIADSAIAGIKKDDPMREYIIAAINDAVNEFKKTDKYKKLPETDQKSAGAAGVGSASGADSNPKSGTTEQPAILDETETPESGTVIYQFSEGGYQESFTADNRASMVLEA
ncbi:MAG: hypothetical protein K5639_03085 [Eubacterium sp.]|nr:hypothetical protein [Eubacterium sp.]